MFSLHYRVLSLCHNNIASAVVIRGDTMSPTHQAATSRKPTRRRGTQRPSLQHTRRMKQQQQHHHHTTQALTRRDHKGNTIPLHVFDTHIGRAEHRATGRHRAVHCRLRQ